MITKEQLNLRIDVYLLARLRAAADSTNNPYAPSLTQIVERGIDLALKELDGTTKKSITR